MTDDEVIAQVRDILDGWSDVRVERVGGLWVIGARCNGQAHAGARDNAITLAGDLAALSHGEIFHIHSDDREQGLAASVPSNRDVAPAQPHQTGGDQGGAAALSPAAVPPAYPGTMITENERATLTGLLLGQIARHAKERIEARYDANARHGIAQTMSDYTNKVALQLPVSDAERDAFDDAQAADRWIGATQAFRDQLFGSLADLPLNMLQHYAVEGAPWP